MKLETLAERLDYNLHQVEEVHIDPSPFAYVERNLGTPFQVSLELWEIGRIADVMQHFHCRVEQSGTASKEVVDFSRYLSDGCMQGNKSLNSWRYEKRNTVSRALYHVSDGWRSKVDGERTAWIRGVLKFREYAAGHIVFRDQTKEFQSWLEKSGHYLADVEEHTEDPRALFIVDPGETIVTLSNFFRPLKPEVGAMYTSKRLMDREGAFYDI